MGSLPEALGMAEGRRAQEVRGPRRCTAQSIQRTLKVSGHDVTVRPTCTDVRSLQPY